MTHENQEWVGIYRSALMELEHAKMTGRIGDARNSIATRFEKLMQMPSLHTEERQALEDALNNLRVLELEEERFQAEERRIAERALKALASIAPRIEKLK